MRDGWLSRRVRPEVRLGAALLGGLLALGSLPLLAVAGFLAHGWDGLTGPPLLVRLYAAVPAAFHWADPVTVQRTFGRTVLPSLLPLTLSWSDWVQADDRRVVLIVTRLGLLLCLAGAVTDYWLGVPGGAVARLGFGLFFLPGLPLLLGGMTVLGWERTRRRVTVPSVLWLLSTPLALLNSGWGLRYQPAAALWVIGVAFLVGGVVTWWSVRRGLPPAS